jgi:hypothetical protein
MAKSVTIALSNGSTIEYKSTLFTGYHLHRAMDGVCVTKKQLFRSEEVVACFKYQKVRGLAEDRCGICETVNPTQRSNYN